MDNLDQTKRELMDEVKGKLIEELNLEEITPEDIDNEAPLFGDEGLGLDSIDALEIILILEREYGIKIEKRPVWMPCIMDADSKAILIV